ncbi:MAG: hypothetical protein V3U11_01970 [Planctomycetota bacterium]
MPSYRLHKASGQAVVTLAGKDFYLGKYDTEASKVRYQRVIAEYMAGGAQIAPNHRQERKARSDGLTVEQLTSAYERHLETKHDPAWLSNNLDHYRLALRPLKALYGDMIAAEFSPLRLQAVRDHMIKSTTMCRSVINQRVSFIRRMFRWAVSHELVPPELAHGLQAVEHLKAGEFDSYEGKKVSPVSQEVVWATLPYLARPVAGLVELLWWTGARPSEVLRLRPCDLDRSGSLWMWTLKLDKHKTHKHGCTREIAFGPRAQEVLTRFLNQVPAPDPDKPIFSPRDAVAEHSLRRRQARTSPLTPSQRHPSSTNDRSPRTAFSLDRVFRGGAYLILGHGCPRLTDFEVSVPATGHSARSAAGRARAP